MNGAIETNSKKAWDFYKNILNSPKLIVAPMVICNSDIKLNDFNGYRLMVQNMHGEYFPEGMVPSYVILQCSMPNYLLPKRNTGMIIGKPVQMMVL